MPHGGEFDDFILGYDAVWGFFFSLPPCTGQIRLGQGIASVNLNFKLMGKCIVINEVSIGEQLWKNASLPST